MVYVEQSNMRGAASKGKRQKSHSVFVGLARRNFAFLRLLIVPGLPLWAKRGLYEHRMYVRQPSRVGAPSFMQTLLRESHIHGFAHVAPACRLVGGWQ
jgi:hypothetical protein